MNTSPSPVVSIAIEQLLEHMEPYRGSGEVVIEGASWDAILDGLRGVQRMSVAVERELGAFRALEAGRFATNTLEQVATTAAGELVLDPEGKVVKPDFGRRS